ncbi:MAG TPA: hypothetical protein VNW06_10510 [Cytophagaceae bacterium]|jgi:hypothetical protein|nr:hypothetical protein [Cytophagaceae bacterium]
MLKRTLFPSLIAVCLLAFPSCKKDSPSPAKVDTHKTSTISAPNEFTVTGDGYSSTESIIDTGHYVTTLSFAHAYNDSIGVSITGSSDMGGVTNNVEVAIATHYTGLKSYTIGSANTLVEIAFIAGSPGSYYDSKIYTGISGTLTFNTANVGGVVDGTYSGSFMINNNPANVVTITNGKFSTFLQ